MKAAFYKAKGKLYNYVVRGWERGPYSHVELVFSNGEAASSSFMDKGVRFKQIDFTPDKWDFVELPSSLEQNAYNWFLAHRGCKYDLIGQFRFIISPISIGDGDDKWWCSEAVAASLGIVNPWRYGPNGLHDALQILALTKT